MSANEHNPDFTEPVPNVHVWMIHRNLLHAPRYALPDGYRMRFYHEGDVATWVGIQQAAETFLKPSVETFAKYMPGDAVHLSQRVMFLVDPSGKDIGSITAWNGTELNGRDMGLIHWVAIIPEAQGHGLSKLMLSAAVDVLRMLGYIEAWLGTGTGRIPALNLYLQFGFEPYVRGELDRAGWLAVAPQLKFAIEV